MKNLIAFVVLAIVVYLISWSIAYFWLMGSEFKHYFEYLRLAWTSPGEIPAFIQIASIIATILIMLVIIMVVRSRAASTSKTIRTTRRAYRQ
jgi:hypothetical protein